MKHSDSEKQRRWMGEEQESASKSEKRASEITKNGISGEKVKQRNNKK